MGKAEMSVHCPSFENAWYRGATVTDVVLYPSGVLGQKKRLRSTGLSDFLFVLKYNYDMSPNSERIYTVSYSTLFI